MGSRIFSCGALTIVAGIAGGTRWNDLIVREADNGPSDRRVARFTSITSRQMLLLLAGCANAVVAGEAAADDTSVIKSSDIPGHVHVAGGAVVAGTEMVEWFA